MLNNPSNNKSASKSPSPAKSVSGATTTADGLQIKDTTVGTGAEAVDGKSVSVLYTGKLADGTVFDSTSNRNNQPFTFNLGEGQVIKGWDEGVAGMKVGGTRELVMPPSLGYGSQSVGSIPPNSTLYFTVTLQSVN